MKTKLSFLLVAYFGISIITYGQKTTVGILPFTFTSGSADYQTVKSIDENITNAFVKTKRFNIVDRAKMGAVKAEKELQKTEDFIDGTVVAQSSNLGAEFLVSGHVSSATTERMTTSEGAVSYKAKLAITLKVIDVETSQVLHSENIKPKSGSMIGGLYGVGPTTPEIAIEKALKDIEKDVDEFVAVNFPLTISIAEVSSTSEILIAVGSQFGAKKKDKFKVVEQSVMEVNGKQLVRKKEIGQIIISSVEDENFSKCKVKSGGDVILAKFNSGAKVQCISID